MNLPKAPSSYDASNERQTRGQIEQADEGNFKKGEHLRFQRGEWVVLPDEVTGDLYRLKVASGVLSIVGPLSL